ncbi:5-formyltetrahydrofolate cyclo-ligase [Terribacillus saccharophilus]|uniref:5-formyltetrahydrofolate cyclo-ligase n=1 Tax=Terribacillus saccharophilus TaxID=361277 RepID=UPI000BA55B1E|nr:5-formyltetrahydrofolate cyclo-ligase [Terribacillus saccharophilus]PAF19313.1 5-formyltetrahydrofolate cyclo-ligase [Terribacillus saccharophilus]PAF40838.1 5-formyltetrahydrofolate cyclo-ligase [Terribacillus saccharophilus]
MEEKAKLRQEGLRLLKEMPQTDKLHIEHRLAEHLFASTVWKGAKSIGLTMALPHEWDTTKLIQQAWLEKKRICVPLTIENRAMQFYHIESYNQLTDGAFSIKEPIADRCEPASKDTIDLLIVPGLLFDMSGYRIGYGGGYYDRYLTDYQNKTLSLAGSQQIKQSLPVGPLDLPVDHLLTDDGFLF